MKFNQFVLLKENDIAAEIEDIFQQTSQDIERMFADLYKGTANMVRNAQGTNGGGAALPTQFLTGILNDLKQIAGKVKDAAKAKESEPSHNDPRIAKSENVVIDAYINDIWESVSDVVNGLGSKGQSAEGKNIYDFQSALNNVKQKVMERMGQLRAAVLKAMGVVTDIHGSVGKINKGFGKLNKSIAGLPDALQARQANPRLSAEQIPSADHMVKSLYGMKGRLGFPGEIFLVPDKAGARGVKIDVDDELQQNQVIKAAQANGRLMKVKYTLDGNNKAVDTGLTLDLGSDDDNSLQKINNHMTNIMKNLPSPSSKSIKPSNKGPLSQGKIPGTN